MSTKVLSDREVYDLYDEVMKTNLHHSTLIYEYLNQIESLDSKVRDKAVFVIKREVNTIKRNLGRLYPFCTKQVKEVIDEIANKGTQICALTYHNDFRKNNSTIGMWASAINDIRLDLTKSPWEFLSGINIDLNLIKIDLGPSALDIG